MPLVSVVIPCYNLPAYLGDAVQSALAQTVNDVEVVVVDDGSTEDLEPALAPYRHDPRLRSLRTDANRGPGAARNAGAQITDSAFVAFLDADDQWLPRKLEAQLGALEEDPESAACASGYFIVKRRVVRVLDRSGVGRVERPYQGLLFRNLLGNPSAVLLRRRGLEEAGGFCEEMEGHEDHDLWSRLALRRPLLSAAGPLTILRRDRPDSRIRNLPAMAAASETFLRRRALDSPAADPRMLERARVVHALRTARMAVYAATPGAGVRYSLRAVRLALRPVSFGFALRPALSHFRASLRRAAATRRRNR